ncbi:vWA domain-containing protein [Rummeliibacillus pycnus]|uniref:vWA domain-containing protein n=1 Tax=Rummeliibacillus pycnus TaxID=101070 RepID=UPI003D28F7D7
MTFQLEKRKIIDNNSVINTDSFDRRHYQSLVESSKELKSISKKQIVPYFNDLIGDVWASLYKFSPQIQEDVSEKLVGNKRMIENVMNDELYEEIRPSTKMDSLMSALTSIRFSEKISDWIDIQNNSNEEFQEKRQALDDAKNSKGRGKKQRIEQAEQDLQQVIKQSIEKQGAYISQLLNDSYSSAKDTKEKVEDLMAGNGRSDLKKVPFKDQIHLAELLNKNTKLKEIAEWAGRFKSIARKKQKSKHQEALARTGVVVGNEIKRLLPSELLLYNYSGTRLDFLRRFAEEQTLMFDQKGKESLGQGAIVCCLDQSGSMKNLDTQSKGFALALMMIAKRQKRDFVLITFSSSIRKYEFPKGKYTNEQLVEVASAFLDGGTNFVNPLDEAIKVIQKEKAFKKADIVFITDGDARVLEEFQNRFKKIKKELDFKLLTLLIKTHKESVLEPLSDKCVKITDFNDEKAFAAFEI